MQSEYFAVISRISDHYSQNSGQIFWEHYEITAIDEVVEDFIVGKEKGEANDII